MDIPIFDITTISHNYFKLTFSNLNYGNTTSYNITTTINKQLSRIFKLNKENINDDELIMFIQYNCDYATINNTHKSYYICDYVDMTKELFNKYKNNNIFLVMQIDMPLQIFIPEDKYTYLEEYANVILTLDNMNKLNDKIIKFSLYYQNYSTLCNKLTERIEEYKRLYTIRWLLKNVFVLDLVNHLSRYMCLLMHKNHLICYEKMINKYSKKFNNMIYGYEYKDYDFGYSLTTRYVY